MTDLYSKWAILSSQCIPDSQKECPALFPLIRRKDRERNQNRSLY
ncbi:Hypothetical protein PFR_JS9-1_54 [Propionibacterium freudenreichii]|nr:Hypothetical protein PFR_JS9-1_54 [Propionibacterium freudenreichii]